MFGSLKGDLGMFKRDFRTVVGGKLPIKKLHYYLSNKHTVYSFQYIPKGFSSVPGGVL